MTLIRLWLAYASPGTVSSSTDEDRSDHGA